MITPFSEKWISWLRKIGMGWEKDRIEINLEQHRKKEKLQSPLVQRVLVETAKSAPTQKRVGVRDWEPARQAHEKKKPDPKNEHYNIPHRRHKPVWHGHH